MGSIKAAVVGLGLGQHFVRGLVGHPDVDGDSSPNCSGGSGRRIIELWKWFRGDCLGSTTRWMPSMR